jgi:hypothetical protein
MVADLMLAFRLVVLSSSYRVSVQRSLMEGVIVGSEDYCRMQIWSSILSSEGKALINIVHL